MVGRAFVHGGAHASRKWQQWLSYFVDTGRHCYSFSWRGHNGSRKQSDMEFAAQTLEAAGIEWTQQGSPVVQKCAETKLAIGQVLPGPSICVQVG